MKLIDFPMTVTDWSQVEPSEHAGNHGVALWRTQMFGEIRTRMVEYSPGYVSDHWCDKGHIVLCLSGSLDIELRDGGRFGLAAGQSYQVGDGDPPHRSSTVVGAKLFIVD
jgi:hypothetical protein